MNTLALYPWESPAFVAEEDAELVAIQDDAREAWLDDFLAELFDEPTEELAYEPFQLAPEAYSDCAGTLGNEIGYAESVTPFNF